MTSDHLLVESPQSIGDIILLNEHPTFLDFEYFQKLFSENGAIKFSNEQNKKQMDEMIRQLKATMPKGSQLPPDVKEQVKQIKEQIKELETTISNAEPERKDTAKTIEVIRNTIPYNRFIMTEDMLIPLDDKNFRDQTICPDSEPTEHRIPCAASCRRNLFRIIHRISNADCNVHAVK